MREKRKKMAEDLVCTKKKHNPEDNSSETVTDNVTDTSLGGGGNGAGIGEKVAEKNCRPIKNKKLKPAKLCLQTVTRK